MTGRRCRRWPTRAGSSPPSSRTHGSSARKKSGEEAVHDDWQSWLNDLSGEAVDELIECANGWLEEDADETDWEVATLRGYTEQGAALSYFRDDFPCSDLFNIVIVEGDHPGSTYYAAELRMSVEDANLIAEAEGLPIRFEWSGD